MFARQAEIYHICRKQGTRVLLLCHSYKERLGSWFLRTLCGRREAYGIIPTVDMVYLHSLVTRTCV